MSKKRISLVMASSSVDTVHQFGLYSGILKGIMDEAVVRFQEGTFKNLIAERPKVRFDICREETGVHLIKIQ